MAYGIRGESGGNSFDRGRAPAGSSAEGGSGTGSLRRFGRELAARLRHETGGSGDSSGPGQLATGGAEGGRALLGRYALLPLRIFLGVTFIYAGLDKLTDSAFMSATGPDSVGETMRSVEGTAAIGPMIDLALQAPVAFGYVMGFGELAAGIGTLFGILARVAALGGAFVSLSLWLTVTWTTAPYYYGNDLAYLMAWVPLILAGAPYLSVDAMLRRRRAANRQTH